MYIKYSRAVKLCEMFASTAVRHGLDSVIYLTADIHYPRKLQKIILMGISSFKGNNSKIIVYD
jgi:hypothetical protein